MAPPSGLPYDVIYEILSRTPVKSLCRFRCVSKEWNALISDPAFVAAHRRPDPLLVALFNSNHAGKTTEMKVMEMNGNVLRSVMDGDDISDYRLYAALDGSPYIDVSSGQVVDLATGHVIMACPPELRERAVQVLTIGRAGAATPSSCTYKAVCISHYYWPCIYQILTLGEEDAEWRPMPPPPYDDHMAPYLARSLVTLNGVVYFLVDRDTSTAPLQMHEIDNVTAAPPIQLLPEMDIGVMCFDLESETWKETIDGPPVDAGDIWTARITLLNDALSMVVTMLQHSDDFMSRVSEVWMLSDDDGGWTKTYSIPADPYVVDFYAPLRVMTRDDDGRKQLLSCCYDCRLEPPTLVLRLYDSQGGADEAYTAMDLPADGLFTIAGVCSLHLKQALSSSFLPRT